MLHSRLLGEDDISRLKWIDRAEVIEAFYRLQDGQLLRYEQPEVVYGWPEGEAEHDALILQQCYQRGGWLYGVFDGPRWWPRWWWIACRSPVPGWTCGS